MLHNVCIITKTWNVPTWQYGVGDYQFSCNFWDNQICRLLYYAVVTPESTLSYIPVCLLLGLMFLIATLWSIELRPVHVSLLADSKARMYYDCLMFGLAGVKLLGVRCFSPGNGNGDLKVKPCIPSQELSKYKDLLDLAARHWVI